MPWASSRALGTGRRCFVSSRWGTRPIMINTVSINTVSINTVSINTVLIKTAGSLQCGAVR